MRGIVLGAVEASAGVEREVVGVYASEIDDICEDDCESGIFGPVQTPRCDIVDGKARKRGYAPLH